MRTPPPPGKKRVADWIGLKVRLVRDVANGHGKWPKGLVCTVASAGSGLCLVSEKCTHCGVMMYVTKVHPDALEIIK